MKKNRYLLVILGWFVLFLLFQFACVKKIPRFAPGDEFLSALSLMSEKDYQRLLSEADAIDLTTLKPEQADKIAFMAGLAAMNLQDYDQAQRYFEYCRDNYRELEDYTLYYLAQTYFQKGEYKAAFETAKRCVDTHPDSIWNSQMTVMMGDYYAGMGKYEAALTVYDAFLFNNKESKKYPSTLYQKGKTLEEMGRKNEALALYREIWIDYPTSDAQEKAFEGINRLGAGGGFTVAELKKRIDNLYDGEAYDRVISAAAEMPALLGKKTGSLPVNINKEIEYLKAKSYFKSGKYESARELFEALLSSPENLPRVELLYWRAQCYNRLDRDDMALAGYLDIFNKYPKTGLAEESIYLAARTDEELKRYDDAIGCYETYLSSYSRGDKVRDVLWSIGWLYFMKKDYAKAEQYFARMAGDYSDRKEYPQYLYWQARALEKQNKLSEAIDLYKTIRTKYITTYYCLQAQDRLKKLGVPADAPSNKKTFDESYWTRDFGRFDSLTSDKRITSHLAEALQLMTMNLDDAAAKELNLVVDRCVGSPELLVEVARLLRYSGDYYTPILIATSRFSHLLSEYHPGQNELYWQMKYPTGYKKEVERYAREYRLEPSLVYAVMREESLFQPRVNSWAGAIGVMQIMPTTGRTIASELGMTEFKVWDLADYQTNIRFGAYYLSGLMKDFNGEKVYALCSYNAGPGNTRKWIKNSDPDMEMDEFIENIPFAETKGYVKRILNTESIYRAVYEGADRRE